MKVIKKINNNCALCVDEKGRTIVAFGKGIGFKKTPYELDIKDVENAYYEVNDKYKDLLNNISPDVLEIANDIIEIAKCNLDNLTNMNVVFALADHINFAIQRQNEGIKIKLPIINNIKLLYGPEIAIGKKALDIIQERLGVRLPEGEATCIALHIINAETIDPQNKKHPVNKDTIEDITRLVEESLKIDIDKDSYNYSRFINHIYYLFSRNRNVKSSKDNAKIYRNIVADYPQVYSCVREIKDYFCQNLQRDLCEDEMLYLMLHLIRLCNREQIEE